EQSAAQVKTRDLQRAGDVVGKAARGAVVALGARRFVFPAQAEIQRQLGRDAEVILKVERLILIGDREAGIERKTARSVAQQHGGETEPRRRRGGVGPAGFAGAEAEAARGSKVAEEVAAKETGFPAGLKQMLAALHGYARLQRPGVAGVVNQRAVGEAGNIGHVDVGERLALQQANKLR